LLTVDSPFAHQLLTFRPPFTHFLLTSAQVTDIIEFGTDNLISSLRAYKG
jgi:hypothetical protein